MEIDHQTSHKNRDVVVIMRAFIWVLGWSSALQPNTLLPQLIVLHSELSSPGFLLPEKHTHAETHTAATPTICYFANCNPEQDNKIALRHFVNISALARSASAWPSAF